MAKAIERINEAVGNKERILVYGDYDVDGTTAVALVYKMLRQFTSNIDYYIPDSYDVGYGISQQGVDYAAETHVGLVIALDCGIKALDMVEYARQRGIDFIICDHHKPGDTLPNAVAVVDPKRADSIYPYEHLSACGVGFKVLQAFIKSNPAIGFSDLNKLLDLVAVSIASDIVPITGENRILTYFGLRRLNREPCPGLKAIIDICGINTEEHPITVNDIVFKIGPRINASGRMMKGKETVELLLASTLETAKEKCLTIDQYNEDRKELDKKMTEEAAAFVESDPEHSKKNSIVVYNPQWHKGVIGIVASRMTEKYLRPAIILTMSNGLVTGSARSAMIFDIYKVIEACSDLLENFGGHTYAVGLSMKEENYPAFKQRFESLAKEYMEPEMMKPQINIEACLKLSEIDGRFGNELKRFAPFGPENQNPIFMSKDIYDFGTSQLVGLANRHIKLDIVDRPDDKHPHHAIAFHQSEAFEIVASQKPFDICYTLEENQYKNKSHIQLHVKDIEAGK
jgi:single-stranded-DNA-specific exonuclease